MTKPSWQDYGTYDESEHATLWDGVVGAWCPSLGPTGSRLHDHSRFSNWGTLTNMDNATDWVVDGGQYALDFDGVDDNVVMSSRPLRTGDFTVSVWVYPRRLDSYEMWFGSADNYWYFGSFNSIIAFDTTSNTIFRSGSGAVAVNVWQHFVAIRRGGVMRLYKDGMDQGVSTADTFDQQSTTYYIGRWQTASHFADALFGDVMVYNRALTANEVRDLYLLGRGGMFKRRRRSRRRAIEQAVSGVRRRRLLTGMV